MDARLDFYYAFIFPYLSYNVIVWGGTSNSYIKPIVIQQKRILRTICNSSRLEHTTPLFSNLKLLKFQDIYKFSMCVHMHKSIAAGNFAASHNVNTRNNNLAAPLFHCLTTCQHAVSFRGPQLWNSLPLYLRNTEYLPLFKKY